MNNDIHDNTLRAAIATLPRELPPKRDLWPGIAAQIAPRQRWSQPWAIAAAAAALIVLGVAAATFGLHRRAMPTTIVVQPPAPSATPALGSRGQFIATVLRNSRGMDPKTQAVLLKNLDIIETSIANIQRALAQDPGNAALQPLLYQLYRDEAALVTATQRVQLQHATGAIAL